MDKINISQIDFPINKNGTDTLHPNLFYSEKWLNTLSQEYNYDFFEICDESTNHFLIVALINQFGISKIKGLPFCDYMVPSVASSETLNRLINRLKSFFSEMPIEVKILLPDSINQKKLDYDLKHTAYCHTVTTSVPLDKMESKMDNSFLRGVRKARSQDLKISMDKTEEALSKFYHVYAKQRVEKFEKLPQPYSFFNKIWKNLIHNDDGFILQAKKDSTVIASMIILCYHKKLYYKFGCSLKKYLDLRPNNLLFYHLFKYAQQQNMPQVDLGLSGVSKDYQGLVRFKEYMGGEPTNIYSLRLEPDDYDNSAEKEMDEFTSLLTKTIVNQNPDEESLDTYSKLLYPYFA